MRDAQRQTQKLQTDRDKAMSMFLESRNELVEVSHLVSELKQSQKINPFLTKVQTIISSQRTEKASVMHEDDLVRDHDLTESHIVKSIETPEPQTAEKLSDEVPERDTQNVTYFNEWLKSFN